MSRSSADLQSRPPIRLRPARASDRPFAEALYLATMQPLLSELGFCDPDALRARFARSYRRERSRIVGAAGLDVGWMQVSRTATGFYLDQLHLVPDWRDHGIGGILLRRLLLRAGRDGADVGLDVIHGNRAIALYRRLGFAVRQTDHEKKRMVWHPAPRQD
jgi:ribosomal protein S18 acetylase RimI-like enzyme